MLGQLAAAAAERREMLAGLTHDLRAPLTRLRLRLALLAGDAQGSSECAGLVRDVDDMERIVGQCLAFLRSENPDAAPAPLAIAALLREERRPPARTRPCRRVDGQRRRGAMPGGDHRRQSATLLDNLIDNALQHGAPPVEVQLALASTSIATLRVRDHGPGIAGAIAAAPSNPSPSSNRRAPPTAVADSVWRSCGESPSGCGGEVLLADAPGGGLEVWCGCRLAECPSAAHWQHIRLDRGAELPDTRRAKPPFPRRHFA
jgi:two-component system osmolarity sensor histidine kinase EnvZ